MKNDEMSELRKMTIKELHDDCVASSREQFNFAIQKATAQTVRPHLMRVARRKVARIMTVLREKQAEGKQA